MKYIHPTAIVYPCVTLPDNYYIGAYSVIGGPAEHPEVVDPHKESGGTVIIFDNVTIREHVTINRPVNDSESVIIGKRTYIMSKVHIGHDVYIGDDCVLHTGCIIGGHACIRDYCRIGLGAVLHQHTRLAFGTMVGANAFVKGNWAELYRILAGVPAKDIGVNQRLIDKIERDHE